MAFSRIKGVSAKIINDISKTIFITTIIVQIIFIGVYGYSIFTNWERTVFFIIYCALLALSIVTFISTLVTHKRKKNKTFSLVIRIIRYFINGAMVMANLYEVLTIPTTELRILLLIISAISLLTQILLEITLSITKYYFNLYRIAFERDFQFFIEASKTVSDPKTAFLQLVDRPLEAIANHIENKPVETPTPTKSETLVAGTWNNSYSM
ncbi:MAG: hypothetical protein IKC64_06045, partial [Clostridia bacterium]|nr:hypothetical protein [Clostridia bacterium]